MHTAVRFSCASDALPIADGLSLSRDYTVFIVDQYSGALHGRTLQSRDVGVNWLIGKWANRNAHYANGFVFEAGNGNHSTTIGEGIGYANNSTYVINGTNVTNSGAPTGSPGHLGLGSSGTFNEPSNADVAEIIIYDRALSLYERREVGTYLQSKYGIAGTYTFDRKDKFSVGTFSGGDGGEGLDLNGEFVYAIDFGEPNNVTRQVGEATFTSHAFTPGMTFNATNKLTVSNWGDREYGATTNDNNLETIMESIRWSTPKLGHLSIDLAGLDPGHIYKLQLLFAENCCANRTFDISIEGELILDNFQGSQFVAVPQNGEGLVFTYQFTALDSILNIDLRGAAFNGADTNPIINGLTLEHITPEPSVVALSLMSLGVLGRRRRRVA